MKKLLLSMSLLVCFGAISQTTIYSEDFTTGSTWTLNTILGVEDGFPNSWYISCQEDGQMAGACGTACTISDNSLHVSVNAALGGDLGAAYAEIGAFTGTNRRAESGNISTIGETGLTLSFDMIGAGNAQDYTELFYSINGGASWVSLATPLTSLCCGGVACTGTLQGLWQNNVYALPASCENISNLRVAFVWKNLDDGIATDPSFAVDDILITASSSSESITTNNVTPSSWCTGTATSGTVDFVATGTFNVANVYSAELSDAAGAFGSPTVVGTLASSASGSLSITTTIPGAIPAGNGYRIRVVASDPATTGTDNGTDLVSNPLPFVDAGPDQTVCDGVAVTVNGAGAVSYVWSDGVTDGVPFVPAVGTLTLSLMGTDANGCVNSDQVNVIVNPLPTVTLGTFSDVCINHSASTLTGGTPAGGTYSGTGVTAGMFDPGVAGVGTHTITYTFTDGNSCTNSTSQPLVVDACASISELNGVPMTIFPNPTDATFSISTDGIVSQVELLDMSGRTVKSFDVNNDAYDVRDINSGVYLLRINNNSIVKTIRLVIK